MSVIAQPRLLDPPRVKGFCPAKSCARSCDATEINECTCLPCRCPDCRSRTSRARGARLHRAPAAAWSSQERLFANPRPEWSVVK